MIKEEKRLKAEIEALVGRAGRVDAEEDERYGVDVRGDEMPAKLKRRKDRLAAIREAKARLEAQARAKDAARGRLPGMKRNPKGGSPYKRKYGEPEAKAQSNFTDSESRIMKTSSDGFQQCYNAQLAVDGERQMIVAADVTANASDQCQMLPRLAEVEASCGAVPEQVLADAGYCNERDLTWLSEAPNGWIKQALGFRQFSVRGLHKVQGEWALVCLALNIRRMQGLAAA